MASSGSKRLEQAQQGRSIFTKRFDKADDYLNANVYNKSKKKKVKKKEES